MKFTPIHVECRAGYTADEYPTSFFREGIKHDIIEILDRWYQYNIDSDEPPASYFKVLLQNQEIRILKHETGTDEWFLAESR